MPRPGAGLLATSYAVYKTIAISVPTLVDAFRGQITVEKCDARLAEWSSNIVARAGIRLEVEGRDQLPPDGAFILMSNHQSHFDIPILYAAYDRTMRMVAKSELFLWPIWGRAMREAGFVAVDRSGDRKNAMAAMREAGEAIRRGVSVWIAPEGTRSSTGRIGKFKKGGFLLAMTTGTPIVPVSIDGSRSILPKHAFVLSPGARVRVTFGAPIPVAGRSLDELSTEVRARIAAHVTEPAE